MIKLKDYLRPLCRSGGARRREWSMNIDIYQSYGMIPVFEGSIYAFVPYEGTETNYGKILEQGVKSMSISSNALVIEVTITVEGKVL